MNSHDKHTNSPDTATARLCDRDLRGLTVISSDGQFIGEITSFFIARPSWRVEALHIKLRGDIADRLGVERSVFRSGELEVPTRWVQSVGETVVLSVPELELKSALPMEAPKVEESSSTKADAERKGAQ